MASLLMGCLWVSSEWLKYISGGDAQEHPKCSPWMSEVEQNIPSHLLDLTLDKVSGKMHGSASSCALLIGAMAVARAQFYFLSYPQESPTSHPES